ncbi:MAG TPA: hypothetical protein VKE74_01105, partial [Gemmataceae bacterium]|nr:hypothetical protein [Gemmataceae bacterium]
MLFPFAHEQSPARFGLHPMAALEVETDDLEQAREFFARRGVTVLETGDAALIVIADPDGLPIFVTPRVVPPGRFKMVRVAAPPWAPKYARGQVTFAEAKAKHYDAILPAERAALIERRADILALVDA